VRAFAFGCLVAVLPASLWAAEGDEEDEGARRLRLPTARVTALEMDELPESPSSFATVIETSEFAGENETTTQVLSESVGVHVRRFGGPDQFSELSIRGASGQQVVILLDGVRLNSAQSGTVDLSSVPFELLERVEVRRGGGSVQYGSDAIGGVVNLVTRKPRSEPETTAKFAAGSFDTFEGSLSHTRRVGPLDLLGAYVGHGSEGDFRFQSIRPTLDGVPIGGQELVRINNASQSHSVLLRAAGNPADSVRLGATNDFYYVSRGQPGSDLPGQGEDGGQRGEAHERRTRNVFDFRTEADDLGWGGLRGDFRVFNRWERTHFRDPEPQRISGETIDIDQHNLSTGGRSTIEGERSFGPSDHLATLVFELRGDQLLSDEHGDRSRFVFGTSLHDEVAFLDRRLRLLPGVRYDNTEGFDDRWLPSLGLVIEPRPWVRIKSNVEKSFRVPNFDELYLPDKGFIRGNPSLRPEEALVFDVGLELAVAKLGPIEALHFQFSWFYNDIDDMIVFQRINVNTIEPQNTGRALIDGVELAFGFGLLEWFDATVNWTHLDARRPLPQGDPIIGLPPGSEGAIPGRPEDEVFVRLALSPPSGWIKLVAEGQYTADIPISSSGRAVVPERTVYNASVTLNLARLWNPGWRAWPKDFFVSWQGTNLTDQSVRDAVGFPQPGRAHTFSVEGRW